MVKALRAKKKIDEGFDGEGNKQNEADARSYKERKAKAEKDVALSAFADLGNNTKDGGGVMGAFLKSKAKPAAKANANAKSGRDEDVDIGGLGGEERLKAVKDKRKSKKSKTGSKGSKNTATERTSEDEVFEE